MSSEQQQRGFSLFLSVANHAANLWIGATHCQGTASTVHTLSPCPHTPIQPASKLLIYDHIRCLGHLDTSHNSRTLTLWPKLTSTLRSSFRFLNNQYYRAVLCLAFVHLRMCLYLWVLVYWVFSVFFRLWLLLPIKLWLLSLIDYLVGVGTVQGVVRCTSQWVMATQPWFCTWFLALPLWCCSLLCSLKW